MTEKQIIPANGSRLLCDMLKRVLFKSEYFKIVHEVTNQKELPTIIEITNLEWVDAYMAAHPSLRFIALAADGSKIKMK